MDYKPCARRNKLTVMERDGSTKTVQQCAEPACERIGQFVTPEICSACPMRDAVNAKAKRAAADAPPPGTPVTVQVKDERHSVSWLPCLDRSKSLIIACCGNIREVRKCDAKHKEGELRPADCSGCRYRRVDPSARTMIDPVIPITNKKEGCNGSI